MVMANGRYRVLHHPGARRQQHADVLCPNNYASPIPGIPAPPPPRPSRHSLPTRRPKTAARASLSPASPSASISSRTASQPGINSGPAPLRPASLARRSRCLGTLCGSPLPPRLHIVAAQPGGGLCLIAGPESLASRDPRQPQPAHSQNGPEPAQSSIVPARAGPKLHRAGQSRPKAPSCRPASALGGWVGCRLCLL
jgi:hypothetical protein